MKFQCMLSGILWLMIVASSASGRHIDFFDDGAFDVTVNPGASIDDTQIVVSGADGALGGQRLITLTNVGLDGTGAVNASLALTDGDDAVTFTSDATATGNLRFAYGQGGDLNADFFNIPDMPGRAWDSLEVVLRDGSSPSGADAWLLSMTSENGTASEATATVMATSTGDGSFFIPYGDFLADNADLNLQDIDLVNLALDGQTGGTYNVSFFGRAGNVLVPEPNSLLLLIVGLALVGGRCRRRRAR